jgi:pimeloyl-ACP methyl ester carboxylesterase
MTAAAVQNSRLPELLGRLTVASGVGYIAAAYTISRWLTRPTPSKPQTNPADFGYSCERILCRTADGISLVGWLVDPPGARATAALFHGMRGSRETVLSRLVFLAANGYRCLAFDHRAHGESGGKRTSFGYHESRDVVAVLSLIRRCWPGHPCIALGVSMGAAALCYAAETARGWDAIVLESCYHDIGTAFNSRLRHGYPTWMQRLTRGVIWVSERRLGVRLPQLAPVDHVGGLAPTPVFILTGEEDLHATPDEARRLYEHCYGPRELWYVPRAGHHDVFETGGPEYQNRVLSFLSRGLAA